MRNAALHIDDFRRDQGFIDITKHKSAPRWPSENSNLSGRWPGVNILDVVYLGKIGGDMTEFPLIRNNPLLSSDVVG